MTTREELIELLLAARERVAAAESAVAHLRASSMEEIPHAPTSTSELLRVQDRRLRSVPDDVQGLGALVAALREADTEQVDLYVLAENGSVTSVVTTPGMVVGCVVGPDRREAAQDDGE